jgi:hypothetical protein
VSPGDGRPTRSGPATAGSIGTPSTASPVPTGDSQLDRASAINVDEIRDQRAGAGMPAERSGGPAVAANEPPPGQPPMAPNPQPGGSDQPKETPVYKKWWFWVVVGFGTIAVYELATDSSSSPSRSARTLPMGSAASQPGGLTLMRW